MFKNRNILKDKVKESLISVLPVTLIVFALCFTLAPVSNGTLMAFIVGAAMLVVGMGLFTLGTDIAMIPMGRYVGSSITRSRKVWLIIVISLLLGCLVTISEPDLQVLAQQVPTVPNAILIGAVSIGVGLFLVLAMLRILLRIPLRLLLIVGYGIIFGAAFLVPRSFLGVAFDAGGVTTGPMTVPFIMALGAGVAATRSDKNAENDSFGLIALCSMGPILAVMLLGTLYRTDTVTSSTQIFTDTANSREMWMMFVKALPHYCSEVAIALAPVVGFFLIYQLLVLRLKANQLLHIGVGVVYTYLGLVLFLTGANVGFMPAGHYLGTLLGNLSANWLIVPIGMLLGFFIVAAEPAVHILNEQVYEITSGAISQRAMQNSLSMGVAVSVGLSMLRIVLNLPILYLLIPGYAIALLLTFFAPPIFTAIAFDSGGVASGAMTATFLLPLAMGTCAAVGGNVNDSFGLVAMVAMTPLITIQILGVVYRLQSRKATEEQVAEEEPVEELIDASAELNLTEEKWIGENREEAPDHE